MRLLRLAQLALTVFAAAGVHASAPDPAKLAKIAALTVPFVPNAGQWNERAAFAARTFAGTLFVTKEGQIVYSLPGKLIASEANTDGGVLSPSPAARERATRLSPIGSGVRAMEKQSSLDQERSPGWVLSETLVDARGQPRSMSQSTLKTPAGYRPMEGKVSYGIGSDISKHADNLNTYERVNLGEMYPGINVQLRAAGNNVEKIFTVAPQQDPMQINIKLAGADKLEIGNNGELIAHTGNGPVAFTAPIAFQDNASGERATISVAYALNTNEQRYSFALGAYDASLPLIIDPLLQSTYLGGDGSDLIEAMAIHPTSGEIYVAGRSDSTDFPGVTGGAQSAKSTGIDAFVTRFNATLTTRLQSSYLGGTGSDYADALAIHPISGDVYVAGRTSSTDLPGVAGGAQSAKSLSDDAYVTRFNVQLTTRLQSTYLGGSGIDIVYAVAIHPTSGDVYVAGYTDSTDLPGVIGGAQSTKSSGNDAFVSRFDAQLTTRLQSTYHGGTGNDYAQALLIHPTSGEVYVGGYSNSGNLPGTVGGAQSANSGDFDAYITRFNSQLTTRLQSTYFGGTDFEQAYAMAIHPTSGDVYIAGSTGSTDLPGVTGGAQGLAAGVNDVFVARFNAALSTRIQSTYLGGTGNDFAQALAIHPTSSEVYVAGYTSSTSRP